jgi:hypothetical protein
MEIASMYITLEVKFEKDGKFQEEKTRYTRVKIANIAKQIKKIAGVTLVGSETVFYIFDQKRESPPLWDERNSKQLTPTDFLRTQGQNLVVLVEKDSSTFVHIRRIHIGPAKYPSCKKPATLSAPSIIYAFFGGFIHHSILDAMEQDEIDGALEELRDNIPFLNMLQYDEKQTKTMQHFDEETAAGLAPMWTQELKIRDILRQEGINEKSVKNEKHSAEYEKTEAQMVSQLVGLIRKNKKLKTQILQAQPEYIQQKVESALRK